MKQNPHFAVTSIAFSVFLIVILTSLACGSSTNEPPPPAAEPSGAAPAATEAPRTQPTAPPAPVTNFDPARVRLSIETAGSGFTDPLFVTDAGDGSGRVFVLEKVGRIRLLDGTTFLNINDRVLSPAVSSYEREQGLLGLAFHPRFETNGFFYVHYNDKQGNHVLSRFSVANNVGNPASEKILLLQEQPETNFNGGMIAFGADGYLYMGLGTGGTAVELQHKAQDLSSLLGKILRIDVDRGDPYAIPADNPFVRRAGARGEVWAYGLRNPWRFSFDRVTRDLYIGGPGEFKREWVNFQPASAPPGQNFGWPILEGTICWRQNSCDRTGLPLPIIEYNTYEDGNCVVIGGYVYRGQKYPLLQGAYLYGDFCSGRVWAAWRNAAGAWQTAEVLRIATLISSFGEDEAGELYVTGIQNGNVYRITATAR